MFCGSTKNGGAVCVAVLRGTGGRHQWKYPCSIGVFFFFFFKTLLPQEKAGVKERDQCLGRKALPARYSIHQPHDHEYGMLSPFLSLSIKPTVILEKRSQSR